MVLCTDFQNIWCGTDGFKGHECTFQKVCGNCHQQHKYLLHTLSWKSIHHVCSCPLCSQDNEDIANCKNKGPCKASLADHELCISADDSNCHTQVGQALKHLLHAKTAKALGLCILYRSRRTMNQSTGRQTPLNSCPFQTQA